MGNTQSAMFSSVLLCPRRREPKASLPNATGGACSSARHLGVLRGLAASFPIAKPFSVMGSTPYSPEQRPRVEARRFDNLRPISDTCPV